MGINGDNMTKYTGFYICPFCEEKFEWEYVDDGHRKGMDEFIVSVDLLHNPTVSQCSISLSILGTKSLTGYCTHCQTLVEIKDTGNIPKELFS